MLNFYKIVQINMKNIYRKKMKKLITLFINLKNTKKKRSNHIYIIIIIECK